MSTSPERKKPYSQRVQIGRIVGAHGIEGTLRIHPLTDYPERFKDMKKLHAEIPDKPPRELVVRKVSFHKGKGQILVAVEGINDRGAAEELSGGVITVGRDERVDLQEGEYWIDTLIGMDVSDAESGERLGVIEDVMPVGPHDVYQVRASDGTMKMIPAVAEVVREIDVDASRVKVSLPEGLWD
jgi:16S rRNA processing protein RimM